MLHMRLHPIARTEIIIEPRVKNRQWTQRLEKVSTIMGHIMRICVECPQLAATFFVALLSVLRILLILQYPQKTT
ncbi:hypothetical protein D3C85_1721430 [compost metagenome]